MDRQGIIKFLREHSSKDVVRLMSWRGMENANAHELADALEVDVQKDAAQTITPPTREGSCGARVHAFITSRGLQGATCDEVEAALGLPHQTASARVYDLAGGGQITADGQTRKTRSNRKARVWVDTNVFLARGHL